VIAVKLAAAAIAVASLSSQPAAGASTGAGMSPFLVCLSHPAQPGGSYQLQTNGNIPGAQVTDTGTSSEDLTLSTGPSPWKQQLPGMAVPASWISFSYPKLLLVIPQHHISLSAGASASVQVTLHVPPDAARGTYVAGLIVSTGTGNGSMQLGAAAEVPLVFTVGIAKPAWPPQQLAAAGNCWIPAPKQTPWQQAFGTSYGNPPPGWHIDGPAWIYTPPPGWFYTFAVPDHQVYRGGHPVVQCANPADYPDPFGGDEIGGRLPVTSTAPGCARWLAESNAEALGREPAESGSGPPPELAPHRAAVAVKATAAKQSDMPLAIGVLILIAIIAIASRAWARRSRP
jgi:hypothetical protein